MKRDEVIEHVCQTVALAYQSIGDFIEPSDGFCDKCPYANTAHFQHSGKTLRYVRDAVVAKLKDDGYKIADGFDPMTGDEIPKEQSPALPPKPTPEQVAAARWGGKPVELTGECRKPVGDEIAFCSVPSVGLLAAGAFGDSYDVRRWIARVVEPRKKLVPWALDAKHIGKTVLLSHPSIKGAAAAMLCGIRDGCFVTPGHGKWSPDGLLVWGTLLDGSPCGYEVADE